MPEEFDEEALEAARRELNGDVGKEPLPQEFEYACLISEIPADGRRGKIIVRERDEIALFILEGEVWAISNICPHEMSPVLGAGFINKDELTVTCPLHGWVFDIPSGKIIGQSGSVPVYEVKLEGEEVWVATGPFIFE